jgi:hypothetical protein
MWYNVIRQLFPKHHLFVNHLKKIVEHFPNIDQNYQRTIMFNKNFTLDMYTLDKPIYETARSELGMLANPRLFWHIFILDDQGCLIYIDGVKIDGKEAYYISRNIECSPELLVKSELTTYISHHPLITWEFVAQNPFINWDYYPIIKRLGINWDVIFKHKLNPQIIACMSKKATLKDITEIDIQWNINYVSCNPNITWDYIMQSPTQFNWYRISKNPIITWQFVVARLDKYPWDFRGLSENCNITWEIIRDNPLAGWDPEHVSRNINCIKSIQENPQILGEFPWDFEWLSYKVDIDTILSQPSYDWEYTIISGRDDLKWWHVVNHPKLSWEWRRIASNDFDSI